MLLAIWLLSFFDLWSQSFVVMQTEGEGKTSVSGDRVLLTGSYPPASTFKILIAWAALKSGGATPETLHFCADRGGKEVGMAEAMYFSSNDYFRWLGLSLGREKLAAVVRESGFGGKNLKPETWSLEGGEGLERGGNLKVSVEEMHSLTLRLMRQKPGKLSDDLRSVLKRPWKDPESRVFGKSGAWGGAVWMTGFFESNHVGKNRAVTVFVPYAVPDWKPAREKALNEFYRCLELPRPPDP